MNKIYIVIKEYDDSLSKRQPWYSVKKLIIDLNQKGFETVVLSSIDLVPVDFTGNVFKIFGIKDLFLKHKKDYKLIYFMTFPIYGNNKFFSIPIQTTTENWKNLKRIFAVSMIPKFILKYVLNKADEVVVISDRSEEYLSSMVNVRKYIPFISDNWAGVMKKSTISRDSKTIGYFGPPFTTRSFDDIINFFEWLNKHNHIYKKKIITRIERDELKDIENKYLSKITKDKNLKVVSGFLDRESLVQELLEIDILILPFKIVMSELPIVVLEALELGIPIVTTEDSGIKYITKNQKNVLVLKNFKKNQFENALNFIKQEKSDDFNKVKRTIENINNNTLEYLCRK
ncbi:glycosyltransferase [bacterium]|nr:glycosyltransferase [bacterium]